MNEKLKGAVILIGAGMFFSLIPIFITRLNEIGFSGEVGIFFRSFGIVIILMMYLILKRIKLFDLTRNYIKNLIFLGVSAGLSMLFFTFSILRIKNTLTVFVFYFASIILGIIIGRIFFKEKLTVKKLVAFVILLVALLLITFPAENKFDFLGVLFAFLAGIADVLTNFARKNLPKKNYYLMQFYQYIFVSLLMLVFILFSQSRVKFELLFNLSNLIFIFIYSSSLILSGTLLIYGFKKVDFNVGTVYLSSELFFSIFVSVFYFNQAVGINELFGGILIFFSIVILNINFKRWTVKFLQRR